MVTDRGRRRPPRNETEPGAVDWCARACIDRAARRPVAAVAGKWRTGIIRRGAIARYREDAVGDAATTAAAAAAAAATARLLQLVRGWLAYRLVSIHVAIHHRAVVRLLCRRRFPRSDCLAAGQSQRAVYARLLLPIIPSPEKRMSAGKAIIPIALPFSHLVSFSRIFSSREAHRRGSRGARETEMSRDCN